jgi:hypothetical protein
LHRFARNKCTDEIRECCLEIEKEQWCKESSQGLNTQRQDHMSSKSRPAGRGLWQTPCEIENPKLTRELSFDDKDILPARRFSMEAPVDSKVLILQGEQLISLHISEN